MHRSLEAFTPNRFRRLSPRPTLCRSPLFSGTLPNLKKNFLIFEAAPPKEQQRVFDAAVQWYKNFCTLMLSRKSPINVRTSYLPPLSVPLSCNSGASGNLYVVVLRVTYAANSSRRPRLDCLILHSRQQRALNKLICVARRRRNTVIHSSVERSVIRDRLGFVASTRSCSVVSSNWSVGHGMAGVRIANISRHPRSIVRRGQWQRTTFNVFGLAV